MQDIVCVCSPFPCPNSEALDRPQIHLQLRHGEVQQEAPELAAAAQVVALSKGVAFEEMVNKLERNKLFLVFFMKDVCSEGQQQYSCL